MNQDKDTKQKRTKPRPKVEPRFTLAQSRAVRVAISFGEESEDGQLGLELRNARKELDRAERIYRVVRSGSP